MKVNTFFEFQFFVVNKQCCYQIIVYLLQTFGKKSRDILPPPTLTLRGGSMSPFLQQPFIFQNIVRYQEIEYLVVADASELKLLTAVLLSCVSGV